MWGIIYCVINHVVSLLYDGAVQFQDNWNINRWLPKKTYLSTGKDQFLLFLQWLSRHISYQHWFLSQFIMMAQTDVTLTDEFLNVHKANRQLFLLFSCIFQCKDAPHVFNEACLDALNLTPEWQFCFFHNSMPSTTLRSGHIGKYCGHFYPSLLRMSNHHMQLSIFSHNYSL